MWVASAWNPNTNLNERSFFISTGIFHYLLLFLFNFARISLNSRAYWMLISNQRSTVRIFQNPLIRFISKPFFSTFRLLKTSTKNRQRLIKMISTKNTCFITLVFGNILFEYQRKWIRKTVCPRSIILTQYIVQMNAIDSTKFTR